MPAPTRAPAGLAVLGGRRGVRGGLRAVRHRAADLSPPRRLLHEEPRVRHHARAGRDRLRAARRAARGDPPHAGLVPDAWLALMRPTIRRLAAHPRRGVRSSHRRRRRTSCSRRASRAATKYAALVVGRPGLGALLKYELVVTLAQARPGALGLVAAQDAVSAAARIVRPQRRVRPERRAAPSAQDSHRQQRRHRRQLPARREGRDQPRHPDRRRRVHRPQHHPVVQERRHRARRRRQHRLQLRGVLGQPRHDRRERADGGLRLRHRRRPRFLRSVEAGARADAHLGRRHDRRRRLDGRRREDSRRRHDRRRRGRSAPAPSSATTCRPRAIAVGIPARVVSHAR